MGFPNSLRTKCADLLPSYKPTLAFDAGANVGDFSRGFIDAHPEATVHAFEPVPSTYETLKGRVAHLPGITTVNMALGAKAGQVNMTMGANSTTNRIIDGPRATGSTLVTIGTGDDYCRENSIDRVGYLKIDTEGHDLNVLVGFQITLSSFGIDMLETEVGMNRSNQRHVPFEHVKSYLEPMGYSLFHIYEQFPDSRFTGFGYMRRCNAVFASARVFEADRRKPPAR